MSPQDTPHGTPQEFPNETPSTYPRLSEVPDRLVSARNRDPKRPKIHEKVNEPRGLRMRERELHSWDERGKKLLEYLQGDKMRPFWKSFEAQQDFLAEELRTCQQDVVRDMKELNAFKDRLRTDEEGITRLGSSARMALLNL